MAKIWWEGLGNKLRQGTLPKLPMFSFENKTPKILNFFAVKHPGTVTDWRSRMGVKHTSPGTISSRQDFFHCRKHICVISRCNWQCFLRNSKNTQKWWYWNWCVVKSSVKFCFCCYHDLDFSRCFLIHSGKISDGTTSPLIILLETYRCLTAVAVGTFPGEIWWRLKPGQIDKFLRGGTAGGSRVFVWRIRRP